MPQLQAQASEFGDRETGREEPGQQGLAGARVAEDEEGCAARVVGEEVGGEEGVEVVARGSRTPPVLAGEVPGAGPLSGEAVRGVEVAVPEARRDGSGVLGGGQRFVQEPVGGGGVPGELL
ncbi:hypothetical protein RM698_20140 [Streptomyces sp. DSM 41979]|uniref:Uncharacterized protein n=1 Tax=Streptomyces evansiae TaxID=3075535 RepID=A0ABU2R7U6_9ACTN|nr:hypothetical protein [Streptomyces sp. DSM 41979]MDT0411345.1 hypothetical protein [Streptomyces sp. DSM 41979]